MPTPREQMILTAVRLFQRGGYQATSWRKLVQESGAPWGSAHHYFPGGKEQLGVAAVETASRDVESLIAHSFREGRTAAEGVRKLFGASATLLEKSGYVAGCPVATVALETLPDSPAMAQACEAAFSLWTMGLARGLERCGVPAEASGDLAASILAMWEGSLVLARVNRSVKPMQTAAAAMSRLAELEAAPA